VSAPDRETVRAAMIRMADRTDAHHAVLWNDGRTSESILRANARDVARQLRDLPSGYLDQRYGVLRDHVLHLADQLDPQPVSEKP
jgi:hypothetical protein